MRIRLTTSQSRTGPMYFEAGLVRGQVVDVVIGDRPGDVPIRDFPDLRLAAHLMEPLDEEAQAAFQKAGL